MICVWLVETGLFNNATDSLDYFGARRTDTRVGQTFQGVETPRVRIFRIGAGFVEKDHVSATEGDGGDADKGGETEKTDFIGRKKALGLIGATATPTIVQRFVDQCLRKGTTRIRFESIVS